MNSLEITIPVLNEETEIVSRINELMGFLDAQLPKPMDYRVSIADNGSTDRTPELVQELLKVYGPHLHYIRVPRVGVGLALKTAWGASTYDLVGYMDLDLATDLVHLHEMLQIFDKNEADMVTGSRLLPGSVVAGRSLKREITSRGFNFLLRRILAVKFSDGMCGFKFIRRSAYGKLKEKGFFNDGWFFNTEVLVRAQWSGLRIREIAVRWTDSPGSKVRIAKLTREYLRSMFELRRWRKEISAVTE